jgi:hypothetical protein
MERGRVRGRLLMLGLAHNRSEKTVVGFDFGSNGKQGLRESQSDRQLDERWSEWQKGLRARVF